MNPRPTPPAARAFRAVSRRALLRAGCGGVAALAARGFGPTPAALARQGMAGEPVALGVYLLDVLDDPAVLEDFATAIGRTPAYAVWYEGWAGNHFGPWQQAHLDTFDAWGMTPVISWDPFDPHGDPIDQPAFKLANIARGDFDAYVDSWAAGLVAYGKPVYVSFAHEMNGNWTPWGIGVNGNEPGDFILAWRHVHDRFTAASATNVRWVWTPNEDYEGVPALAATVYPGDDYVDWFGMNGFNWGAAVHWANCDCQSAWRTFKQVFDTTYANLQRLGEKPIMIGETASSEVGGDKGGWISRAMLYDLPTNYPQVRAFTWFNKVATGLDTIAPGNVVTTTAVDWPVTSSQAALAAFSHAASFSYYQGSLP